MANAKLRDDKYFAVLKVTLSLEGAKDVHVASRGRHANDEPFFFDNGSPCACGWFELEAEARRVQSLFLDRHFEARVIRDGNAGREWFWLAVR